MRLLSTSVSVFLEMKSCSFRGGICGTLFGSHAAVGTLKVGSPGLEYECDESHRWFGLSDEVWSLACVLSAAVRG